MGDWINLGMPQYVYMDFNPDAFCKKQDTWCGRSMDITKLKLVKIKTVDQADASTNGTVTSGDVNHRTKVLKELFYHWAGK